ncbi:peptidoglycan DD-metalloendopeptidase family protein [Nocardioides caldifontis]|uniref:peptidoglycan DD-metalloendopeptidase family protein n=1 Tax=Nocardioides caldifontis TaxID=2588938 RepID=UPI0011DF3531|nr:peptidoglycan DD-metalloendopeptidase family protein [Nocardioides caldifontis]
MRRSGLVLALALVLVGGLLLVPVLMYFVVLGVDPDATVDCAPTSGDVEMAADTTSSELDDDQLANAGTVIAVGNRMGVPRRGIVVALAVASQESRFRNYANDGEGGDLLIIQQGIEASLGLPHEAVGTDHGSLGIFQQQWPWWGTMRDLMEPAVAAEKFYTALLGVPGWESMPVTVAGQTVQRSAFPDAYADDQALAERLLGDPAMASASVTSASLGGTADCVPGAVYPGTVVYPLPRGASYVDQGNWGGTGSHWASTHTGTDLSASCGMPVLAATNGTVVIRDDQPWAGPWLVQVTTGVGQLTTWYAHMQSVKVDDGDQVEAGQVLGEVGALGNATGCHLHFEVHPRGGSIYEDDVDPSVWLERNVGKELPATGGVEILPADDSSGSGDSITVLTANIAFSIGSAAAQQQFSRVASGGADVLLFQEVRSRPLRRWLPGYVVHQPKPYAMAVAWKRGVFDVVGTGAAPGFQGPRYGRVLPWVVLENSSGQRYAVVSVHMPTGARRHATMRRLYDVMTRNLSSLIGDLRQKGYSPIVGGDWNSSLDAVREPWGALASMGSISMATNWQSGRACPVTTKRGGRIDGFAYDPAGLEMVSHGCMPRGASDHMPVWMRLRSR